MNKEIIYREKRKYGGKLNIGEKIVSIDTKEDWAGIEIDFTGKVEIKSLLPEDYIVKAGVNKIVVVKFNSRSESLNELFEYKGNPKIKKCIIATKELESKNLYINHSSLQLWNTLGGSLKGTGEQIKKDWAYLGENWEDIDFDGNNDKHYYIYRKQVYDKDSKTYTTIKEKREK